MKKYIRYILITIVLAFAIPLIKTITSGHKTTSMGKYVNCVIYLQGYHSKDVNYSVGFNYEMLKKFEKFSRRNLSIRLSNKGEAPLDSLIKDSMQIVVTPYNDSLMKSDNLYISKLVSDSIVWAIPRGRKDFLKEINKWLLHYESSAEYKVLRNRFRASYEPYKRLTTGKAYSVLSPYDSIIKVNSKIPGWDYRLLTAIIWQESKFRIEAISHKGAKGIMQMMPSTSAKYKINNILDANENIHAGAVHLKKIQDSFAKYFSGKELIMVSLAAYNSGEGIIWKCINYADSLGKPFSSWRDIENVLPAIKNSKYQSISYVKNILSLYKAFCAIESGQSLPDPHLTQTIKEVEAETLSQDTTENHTQESKKAQGVREHKKGNNYQDRVL